MKQRKMWIALATAAALLFTGCGGAAETESSSETVTETVSAEKKDTWLTDEKKTITVLAKQDADTSTETNDAIRAIEEATNVHLDIIWVPSSEYADKVNLMLSSGDSPDIITGADLDMSKQIQYGTKEENIIPLNEFIEKYPEGTLAQVLKELPAYKSAVTAPDGNVYGFAEVSGGIHPQVTKMWINKSYVEQMGKEMPTTLDEYRELCLEFKNSDINGNGLADEVPLTGAVNTWAAEPQYYLLNSFIETDQSTFLKVEDSKVSFVADTEEYKNGLKYLNEMYEEGLIDPSTYTQDMDQMRQQVSNEPYTVLSVHCGHLSMAVDTGIQDFSEQWTYLEPLAGPDGNQTCSFHSIKKDNNAWSYAKVVITDNCEDPDLAYRLIDFCTSDEGILMGYGEEGKWWKTPEEGMVGLDGEPAIFVNVQTETPEQTIQKAADQLTIFPSLNSRWHSAQAVVSDDVYDPQNYEFRLVEATKAYEKYAPEEILPYNTMQLSEEDTSNLADIKTNIVNYVTQMTTLFIIGEKDIDSEWESYLDTLKSYNLEEYLNIYQRGLDDWLAGQK